MTGTPSGSGDSDDHTIVVDASHQKVTITIEIDSCGTATGGTTGGGTAGGGTTGGGAGGGTSGGTTTGGTGGTGTQPPEGPTATPHLLIPAGPGDTGARPLPADQALHSQAIQAAIANPTVTGGWSEFQIQLSCAVVNLGAAPSSAALIEFYLGTGIGVWNPDHATLTPTQVQAATRLLGRASFIAPPGVTTTVKCPALWTPGSAQNAQQGVLVQISDLFTDPIARPFNAIGDRHVARADDVMDPIIF